MPDRRQQQLTLTEHGRQHYERAQELVLAQLAPLLAQLNGDELAAVQVALPALRRVLAGDERSDT